MGGVGVLLFIELTAFAWSVFANSRSLKMEEVDLGRGASAGRTFEKLVARLSML